MPVTSEKNAPLSGLAQDLGFGGMQLRQQLADETEEERRRRLLGQSPLAPPRSSILNRANTGALSPSTLSLFGGMAGGR
jgi:hypothetical protein